MTLELFFVGGSFVLGVAQMVESWIVIRDRGRLSRMAPATATVEFAWAVFCVYLLTGRMEFARWLAIAYLAFMVVGTIGGAVLGYHTGRNQPPGTPDDDSVPTGYAWVGGVFGAALAIAALVLLATQ